MLDTVACAFRKHIVDTVLEVIAVRNEGFGSGIPRAVGSLYCSQSCSASRYSSCRQNSVLTEPSLSCGRNVSVAGGGLSEKTDS